MLKKFKLMYEQIKDQIQTNQCIIDSLVDNERVYVGCWFAPKKPFKITADMFLEGEPIIGFKGENTYGGKIVEILNDNQLIVSISGTYVDRMVPCITDHTKYVYRGYGAIRCPSFKIKYTLKDNEIFFTSDKVEPYGARWLEVFYKKNVGVLVEQQSSSDIEKGQQIAKEIGGEYIPETNTIDCKGNKVDFKDDWFNEDGTFDFKLINTTNDWSDGFDSTSLIHLPNGVTIPKSVTDCSGMFKGCKTLTDLPGSFTVPTDCKRINVFHKRDKFDI